MSEIKWIRLSTMMFDDEKIKLIESMPEKDAILVIWIKLLSQAGKCNASGYLILNDKIPYTDEMLATIFNRPVNVIRLALETFKNFGMIDFEDNIFKIADWEYTQNIEGMEKIKEQNRIRKQNQRLKEKEKLKELQCNTDVTKLPLQNDNDKNCHVTSRDSHVTVTKIVTGSHATDTDTDLDTDLEIQQHITESNKNVNTENEKNSKNVVVVKNIMDSFNKKYNGNLDNKRVVDLIKVKGLDTVEECIKVFGDYVSSARDVEKVFYDFTKKYGTKDAYNKPTSYNNKGSTKPTQATNYEQRKYDDDFFDSICDNLKYVDKDDGG